jgi:hypothetical protein
LSIVIQESKSSNYNQMKQLFLSSNNITQIKSKAIFYDFRMNFDKSGSDFGGG